MIERDRGLEDVAQPGAVGILALGALIDLDPGPVRERLEGLGKRHRIALHDEAEDVAAEAAAEALPGIAGGRDRERGCLLAMERAQALVGGARLLELNGLADDVDNVQPALDFGCDSACQPTSWLIAHCTDLYAFRAEKVLRA